MHDVGLLLTLTLGLTIALILGYITHRLHLSPILGYLLAGVVVGPYTPGPVADAKVAEQFAEIGVILLMFGVGLHFSVKDLLAVKSIAIPGAVGQSLVATGLGTAVAWSLGWGIGSGVVLGIAISVASTVVLMRGLEEHSGLQTPESRIAVGWLIVEDIFTVLVLVLLPVLVSSFKAGTAGTQGLLLSIGGAALKLGLLAVIVLYAGGKIIPWILTRVARTRSRELFTLTVLAVALAIATGSAHFFGASMALGAFLAGMVVGQSKESHQAAADALPMRDAFAVLFFVSVGMLFDPLFLLQRPVLVMSIMGIILVAKPLVAMVIVGVLGYSMRTALTVAVGLAQIGEFSFILADQANKLGVLPREGSSVLIASALLSISLNPLLFRSVRPLEKWLRRRQKLWRFLNARAEARGRALNEDTVDTQSRSKEAARAIVVGYGPVGQTVTRILQEFGIHPVIIDLNIDTITRLKGQGMSALYGDASKAEILKHAGIDKAKHLILTLPDLEARTPVILEARHLNADLNIIVRARYLTEKKVLGDLGVTAVSYEEAEAAVGLSELLLRAEGAAQTKIDDEAGRIRAEFDVKRA
ncbi:MAG: sodium:proton exchanger [Planctomycetota bacterium]|nr:MAG: sodium:proton exchanger [Planctomycetota bacterium]